jgi:hypothetical protein
MDDKKSGHEKKMTRQTASKSVKVLYGMASGSSFFMFESSLKSCFQGQLLSKKLSLIDPQVHKHPILYFHL